METYSIIPKNKVVDSWIYYNDFQLDKTLNKFTNKIANNLEIAGPILKCVSNIFSYKTIFQCYR